MESGSVLNMTLQLVQKVILKRKNLSTSLAYQVVMVMMPFFPIEEFSDLITHAPVIKIDTIHQLHF